MLGVVDGGDSLADVDRYISVLLTSRGLQLNNIPTILTEVDVMGDNVSAVKADTEAILDGQASTTIVYPSQFVQVRGFDSATGRRRG